MGGMLEQRLSCQQLCFSGGSLLCCGVPCSLKAPQALTLCPGSPLMHQKDKAQLFQYFLLL